MKVFGRFGKRRFLLAAFCLALLAGVARAGVAPSMTYYVPFPEADALNALDTINAAAVSPISTYISIAAIADNTIIYYDQWEDGYEKTHHLATPVQSTTQIWGDGNIANGYPAGVTNDIIRAGTVILLNNTVNPATPYTLDYDARDKIVSTRAIAVTRTYWAAGSSTLMAGSVETYDTSKWNTDYRVPVGQNIADGDSANVGDHQMFEYTALSIMAAEDGTTVYVDADNNGTFETTNTLNEGQTAFVDGGVDVGARVLATKPVQVLMFTGDVGSNYESRDSTLMPLSMWSNSYYTPVATASGNGTRVWLFNPSASSITVNYRYRVGSAAAVTTNSVTVGTGSSGYATVLLTDVSGVEFYTTGSPAPVFYTYSTTDSDTTTTTDNQAWDWSYTLIPKQLLTPQVLVGLGAGRDPLSTVNPNENGNPIWVTTVGNGQSNATVYVDFNGDNLGTYVDANGHHYDTNFVARELQPLKIYDPDGNQTAMLVYTLSTNVMLAAAWGQDPAVATDSEPGLDAGTAVPPVDVFDVSKSLALVNDSDGDGQLGPGERVSYEINIGNTSRAPVPADIIVQDALPADTAYVAGSTAYRTSTNGSWVAIADDSSGTAFPLDGAGFRIQAAIPVDNFFTVRFQADVAAYANLTPGRASIINTGSVTAVVFNRTLTFRNDTYLHGSLGDRVWNDANGNRVQDAGESGINGVIVYLDSNTNGVRDVNERYATTSGDGNYLLTNALIEAGTHLVRVDRSTLSSAFMATYDLDGTATADAATVALAAGQDRLDVDFGYQIYSGLGDYVWVDSNGNGQQDVGEPGLSNVVVRLYSTNNVVMATATSTVAGAYAFTNLPSGTYTVGFTPPSGYLFTASNAGDAARDSDPLTGTNRTAAVTLSGGQTNLTVDAGFYQLASLSGAVRVDADGDGVIDAEDTVGIAGVTIRLLDAASNLVAITTTSGTGDYSFANLTPGSYTVVQSLPAGFTNTVDMAAPNDLRIPRTLTSGQSSTGNDFYDARTAGSSTAQNKVLYLSDPGQALDRIDPVASGDSTTTNTAVLGSQTAQSVVVGETTSSQGSTVSSLTFSHTPGTGDNRLLLVAVSVGGTGTGGNPPTVTGVTFGGMALTQVSNAVSPATGTAEVRSYIYRLINPSNSAANVVVSLSANGTITAGATTFTGVDQIAPLGTAATAAGASTTASVVVTATTGQVVFGTTAFDSSPTISLPGGSGQSNVWNRTITSPANTLAGAASTEAGAASVTHSYSSTEDQDWSIVAVPIRPATGSGANVVTFTQAPAFQLPLNMASGATVLITNYVNVTSGSMPANPAVTARLSAGGSTFLTLSNPTYSSGSGALVWSGSLSGAVAVSAGQAISLSVSNAQSGVEFQLRYDSATYPSKVILPTASIIAVPSLGVYDAAYAGGTPVTSSPITAQRYVRVTVTDPFGAYDIAGAGLVIDGPGTAGDVSASLNDAHVVSSNAWSKTYEYVWQTVALSGSYALTVTANEGSEGITATGLTTELLYAAALGDRVWNDLDGDGAQEAFEPGIAGVRVYVDSNGSGTYNAGEPFATTAADGTYLIGDLVAGTYTARVDTSTLPAGLTQTYDLNGALDHAASVALTASQTRADVDFGYRSPAVYVIRGQVRDDYDLDGAFSDPDKPVTGVLVTLYSDPNGDGTNTDGIVLGTVRTTPDGRYAFTNVLSGAYVVVESDPTYSVSTADTVAANDNLIPVVIVSADSVGNDFLDAVDPSGYIYDVADGRIVPGGAISVSGPGAYVLMDGSSGQYMFISTNDAPSTFTIAVTPPPGYIIDPTRPAQPGSFDPTGGANPTVLGSYESAVTPGYLVNYSAASNTYYYTFDLAPGDPPVINNNFPLVKVVAIGDRVWTDTNGNGAQDAGEPGQTNVTVRLLNAASNVVATTSTDVSGSYLFTNLPPATYQVEFVAPAQYAFTVRDAAVTNDLADSDADRATGRTAPVAVAAGVTNLTLDAGLYIPAVVYGNVFVDRNADLLRNDGDAWITNALVRLVAGGVVVASTNTDVTGYYRFAGVPPGAVSVLVSRVSATLVNVPTQEPAASDVTRNRALPDVPGFDAYIAYGVVSGYGVLASLPGEPLNFGFETYPLSTALDLGVYTTAGGVTIELWTSNESGFGDIVVYAWINDAWVEVGRVPSWEVVGEGSNRYTVQANGLSAGGAYYFKVVDEAGHEHLSPAPVEVKMLRVEAVRMDLLTLTLAFNTEAGARYSVQVSTDLVAWTTEYASYPTAQGWSDYVNTPFTAAGARTEVKVPANRNRAFFKIVRVEE